MLQTRLIVSSWQIKKKVWRSVGTSCVHLLKECGELYPIKLKYFFLRLTCWHLCFKLPTRRLNHRRLYQTNKCAHPLGVNNFLFYSMVCFTVWCLMKWTSILIYQLSTNTNNYLGVTTMFHLLQNNFDYWLSLVLRRIRFNYVNVF